MVPEEKESLNQWDGAILAVRAVVSVPVWGSVRPVMGASAFFAPSLKGRGEIGKPIVLPTPLKEAPISYRRS